jgi:type II secretory pathway pseudopilin PulG
MLQGTPVTNRNAQSAHTLAEVMVAALILGTMAISLFAGFSAGFAIVFMAREDERATQILNGKIEEIRLCKWRDLTNYPVIAFQEYYDPLGATTTTKGALYRGTISNSIPSDVFTGPGAAPYLNSLRLLTFQVQWTNYNGKKAILRQRQMQTLVAQYGTRNDPWDPPP